MELIKIMHLTILFLIYTHNTVGHRVYKVSKFANDTTIFQVIYSNIETFWMNLSSLRHGF